jgi:hypothetical protein
MLPLPLHHASGHDRGASRQAYRKLERDKAAMNAGHPVSRAGDKAS